MKHNQNEVEMLFSVNEDRFFYIHFMYIIEKTLKEINLCPSYELARWY